MSDTQKATLLSSLSDTTLNPYYGTDVGVKTIDPAIDDDTVAEPTILAIAGCI